jgi:predicted dehydrogenase
MIALVVGYGSIGRRHVRNLAAMAGIGAIFVYTRVKDRFASPAFPPVTFIDASAVSLENCCRQGRPDFAIVANQTSRHVDTAMALAAQGVHLFIEKPLSNSLQQVDLLERTARSRGVAIGIGYNLRYLPVMGYIKDFLSRKLLGELYFGAIEVGQFLPSWRQNISYSDSYSAMSEEGGGVALDLSHEVDYMRHLFGEPDSWKTMKARVSDLKIDTEDVFEGLYRFPGGFICHVHMDYLQREARRSLRLLGSKGRLECDMIGRRLDITTDDETVHLQESSLFDIEKTYADELHSFIGRLASGGKPEISLDDGIRALNLLEDSHA